MGRYTPQDNTRRVHIAAGSELDAPVPAQILHGTCAIAAWKGQGDKCCPAPPPFRQPYRGTSHIGKHPPPRTTVVWPNDSARLRRSVNSGRRISIQSGEAGFVPCVPLPADRLPLPSIFGCLKPLYLVGYPWLEPLYLYFNHRTP